MGLVELEISLKAWEGLPCGCGHSAGHLAEDLLRLTRGQTDISARDALENHVWIPATLYSPAPAVTSVALAVLAEGASSPIRDQFLELLLALVGGDGSDANSRARGLDLAEVCREVASPGAWLLYAEVLSGRSVSAAGNAFEVLWLVDSDRQRLQGVRVTAADLLPWYCRTDNPLFDID
jgi:hypothetical protein